MDRRRVCVTGATGFIGGRLTEVAVARGNDVTCLVRTWHKAARLARFPVRFVHGDIQQPESLLEAMKGCEVVFHCAVDFAVPWERHRRLNTDGTVNVMRAAHAAGIRRVVYLSSIAVHGYAPRPGAATEDAPLVYTGNPYCDGKIDAERAILEHGRRYGVGVTVLRPTIVYGPFGTRWTELPVKEIRAGRMVLVNGGTGICNALYVDNLVDAMFLAADREQAAGEIFHISDARPVTWREYMEAHARALGDGYLPLPERTVEEIALARKATRQASVSSVRQVARLVADPRVRRALRSIPALARAERYGRAAARVMLPAMLRRRLRAFVRHQSTPGRNGAGRAEPAPYLPDEDDVQMYTVNVVFSIDKARRLLAYQPRVDFNEGMRRTAAWIRWARV
ncbi:MAG: NAD-dependent epimerase/dehydratase family protein [Armatimonadota bacterium]|nr:NAD-dependent epimerase/dehydratase family protein [Armatimonadota bacterium]